jgi:hypothetical protein
MIVRTSGTLPPMVGQDFLGREHADGSGGWRADRRTRTLT